MADLKVGTTMGGSALWSQSNFPLFPVGNSLLYRDFTIYSTNDKPQAADNDFVSKAQGGTYKGAVTFINSNTSAQMVQVQGSAAGIQLSTADDSGTLTGNNYQIYAQGDLLRFRGPNSATGGLVDLFQWNNASGAKQLEVRGSIRLLTGSYLDSQGNVMYGPQNKPTPADVGALSITGGTLTGALSSSALDTYRLASSTKSVFQRLDNTSWYFMISDTPTGTFNDLRPLFINISTGLVKMNNGLTVENLLTANNGITVSGGSVNISNGSLYANSAGVYAKDFISTGNLTAGGGVYATTIIEAKPASDPAFTSGQYYNTPEIRARWNTRGATSGGTSFGYFSMYAQEQVGTAFRGCLSLIGYSASPNWRFNQDGKLESPGPVVSDHSDGFRIRQYTQNKAFIHRFDGTNYYMLFTDSVDGSWNSLRPLVINASSGSVTFTNGITVGGGANINAGTTVNSWMMVTNGLNVGNNGNSWGGASITLGDNDSGFRSFSDGNIEIWCNNARMARFDPGQAYFDRRIQGSAGASITDINVYGGDLNQSNDSYSTYCRDLYVRSDIRVKKDLKVFENASESLSRINGYLYLQKKGQNEDGTDRWVQSAGLIAQHVQEQYPELVTEDKDTGLLRLNYNGVIALNTAAINEHTKELVEYKEKVSSLEAALASVLARLSALENK